ncbi:MAG: MFS transporter [Acidobacteria bacterium]|nr:MFS transporter [Acidobacteriota bacterium]
MLLMDSEKQHDAFAALRFREFRLLVIGKFIGVTGQQMLGLAIGWELYERTSSALALGLVGFVQVLPIFLFVLPAGHVADQFPPKKIIAITESLLVAAALSLAWLSINPGPLWAIYLSLFAIGLARAFQNPAISALLPHTVTPTTFQNAATWSSSAWQLAVIVGPALGGLLIGWRHQAAVVYALNVVAGLIFLTLILALRVRVPRAARAAFTLRSLAAGTTFIRRTKVILAAITLDMFAVLLGGATALLPIFAKDILHVGPAGLGWLRAAPSIGAVIVAVLIAHRPPFQRAGQALLWAVAGFGAATIVFGLSTSLPLSLLMLALLGGLDQVSVIIRGTLLMVRTPDELRGRVAAVHNVFLGASNELGEFESGVAASLLGTVIAVAAGGVGTILVVLLIALVWPEIRRLGGLQEQAEAELQTVA